MKIQLNDGRTYYVGYNHWEDILFVENSLGEKIITPGDPSTVAEFFCVILKDYLRTQKEKGKEKWQNQEVQHIIEQ